MVFEYLFGIVAVYKGGHVDVVGHQIEVAIVV